MKLRYVGESFGAFGLTNGEIYEAVIDDVADMYRSTAPGMTSNPICGIVQR